MVIEKVKAMGSQNCAITPPFKLPDLMIGSLKTPRTVIKQGTTLLKAFCTHEVISNVQAGFRITMLSFLNGAVVTAHSHVLANRDLECIHQETIAKVARKKLTNTVAQKFGVITVNDVRAQTWNMMMLKLTRKTRGGGFQPMIKSQLSPLENLTQLGRFEAIQSSPI